MLKDAETVIQKGNLPVSQKIENILNLALEATPEERARSTELD